MSHLRHRRDGALSTNSSDHAAVVGRPYPTGVGTRFFEPLILLPDPNRPLLSFMNVVEVHVLDAIRRQHQIRL